MNTDFQFVALPREAFAPLFAQSDAALAQTGIRRLRVDAEPGYPCRVSLQDARLGETVLLLSWPYHDVASPYRAAGPLFVRENAATATPAVNEIPSMLRHRLLSLRAYDAEGLMHDAEVLEGTALAEHIRRVFSKPEIAYLHIHHARQGCFACRVVRADGNTDRPEAAPQPRQGQTTGSPASIQPYRPEQREAVIALSLRAWQPVFAALQAAVPGFVYRAFYPEGWQARQRADLGRLLDDEADNVWLACHGDEIAGWVHIRLHPEDDMGEIHVLAVAPEYQRQGIGRQLMRHAFACAGAAGMHMVMVETGDDPGHHAARAAYHSAGFVRWPVARYFRPLGA